MNFQNLLTDGEINLHILDKIIKCVGNVKTLTYKSSNGLSFVFISDELDNVFQYFLYQTISDKINNIFKAIEQDKLVTKHIYFNKKNYELKYMLEDYLSKMVHYKRGDNIITWQKHVCLNEFDTNYKTTFIMNNIVKFMWDISKALYGLHTNCILHGDSRLDNIGIRNDKFVLFDFDCAKMDTDIFSFTKDNWDIMQSLKFHIGEDNLNNILEVYPYISSTDFVINDMIEYLCVTQDKSLNIIINELNTLKIIY